jgi:dTDP-4-dehydrorhamnose 3,5-epimerase
LNVIYESEEISLKRSFSKAGVFRGLHIQTPPFGQRKLIRVISGAIIDILVCCDSRKPTFFEIHTGVITPQSSAILIPENFAHGFLCLTEVVFEYLCFGKYSSDHEVVFSPPQGLLNGYLPSGKVPHMSERDFSAMGFEQARVFFQSNSVDL